LLVRHFSVILSLSIEIATRFRRKDSDLSGRLGSFLPAAVDCGLRKRG
jgi:hypothetical protein